MSDYATIQELFDAFSSLSDSDLLALRKAASLRLFNTQYTEPADLIHEALTRCLDGRRNWPKAVPFTVFLANAMKSIADADRNLHSSRLVISSALLETPSRPDPLSDLGPRAPSAEEDCIALENLRLARGQLEQLKRAFCDDPAALSVLHGWMAGMSSKETIAARSLSAKEYDAARKRVARQIQSQSNTLGRTH